jgi:hypothetical protein
MNHQQDSKKREYADLDPSHIERKRFTEPSFSRQDFQQSPQQETDFSSFEEDGLEKKHMRPRGVVPVARRFSESRGPLGRLKGSWEQLVDRYRQHAPNEECLQYAEHYQRLLNQNRYSEKMPHSRPLLRSDTKRDNIDGSSQHSTMTFQDLQEVSFSAPKNSSYSDTSFQGDEDDV